MSNATVPAPSAVPNANQNAATKISPANHIWITLARVMSCFISPFQSSCRDGRATLTNLGGDADAVTLEE